MKKSEIACMIHTAFNHSSVNLDLDQSTYKKESHNNPLWYEISHNELYHSEEWIRQLTPKVFSYYLPAYLKLIIEHYYDADALTDTIISMLTPPLTNGLPRETWINKNLNHFDIKQKEIIALTLKYIYKHHSDQNAYYALNIYWNNFIDDKNRDNTELYT
jgi:hypothetical protein